MDLAEARRNLQAESDDLGNLSATLGVVCDDLEVVRSEGTSSLVAHVVEITAWVRQLKRNALHAGVNQSFAIARSHYGESINLETMSHGFAPSYEVHELEEMDRRHSSSPEGLVSSIGQSIILVISKQVPTLVYHLNKLVILFRLTKSVLLFWCERICFSCCVKRGSCVPTLPFVKTIGPEV